MATGVQVVFDCADPDRLARFWAEALGYVLPEPPGGFATWNDFYRSIGVPEDELDEGADRIVDPDGVGPRMWFQKVPEDKIVKNRLHLDLEVGGGRGLALAVRKERVDAEVKRLIDLGASILVVNEEPGMDHYGVTMQDPEGNEFCLS